MGLSIPKWLNSSTTPAKRASAVTRNYFRPRLDPLEDRVVMASPGSLALPVDVDVNLVNQATGPVLEAVFTVAGGEVGSAVMDVSTIESPDACTILRLEVGAIDLDLLGLSVETSDICLTVTAFEGEGLLGDLLCGLSAVDLGGIIDGLGGLDNFNQLLAGINDLIDDALADAAGGGGAAVQSHQGDEICDIAFLSLGPVSLDLLGVNVLLDDCTGTPGDPTDPGGPVTIDVTADPNGGLLGSLLCGLSGTDLGGLTDRIGDLIDRVRDIVDQIDDLPAGVGDRIDRLLDQLQDAAGRVDSIRELDRFLDRADRVFDRIDRLIDRVDDLRGIAQALQRLDAALDRVEDLVERLERILERRT